jgi:hypothetical protein
MKRTDYPGIHVSLHLRDDTRCDDESKQDEARKRSREEVEQGKGWEEAFRMLLPDESLKGKAGWLNAATSWLRFQRDFDWPPLYAFVSM